VRPQPDSKVMAWIDAQDYDLIVIGDGTEGFDLFVKHGGLKG
jgi:hypothetical protein